jgi:hypothetical protein
MKKNVMLRLLCALVFSAFAAGCARPSPAPSKDPLALVEREYTSSEGDLYRIMSWINDPSPEAGDRFYVYTSMQKNDTYLGGMMYAYWPSEEDDWKYDCRTQISYQIGVCTLFADDFPVGKYIPVKVMVEYEGARYENETGFTRVK